MNKVFLIGNLVRDPEISTTQSGISFCKFTVAVSRRRGEDNDADFIGITAWRATAENCAKFLKKGSKVAISGNIKTGSYEKEGQKVYTTEVVAQEVEFLSTRNSGDQYSGGSSKGENYNFDEASSRENKISEMEPINEELPF